MTKNLTGRCFCGATTWTARDEILWAALCHCEDCRRAASADYVNWFGVDRASVEWTGPRQIYKSSAKVERSFCRDCGSPMAFETEVFPDETHLYAPTLDQPSVYKPTAHIFWSERLAWVTETGGLTTHEKGMQYAALSGKPLFT